MQSALQRRIIHAVGAIALLSFTLTASMSNAAPIWDGGSILDSSLDDAENWVDDTLPATTDAVTFTGNVRTDPYVPSGGITYQSVSFDENAGAFTLYAPGTLTLTALDGVILNNSTAAQTFNAPVVLSGNGSAGTVIRATSGNLNFGDLSIGNQEGTTRLFGGGNTITVSGNLISLEGSGSVNIGTGTAGDDFANAPTFVLAADNSSTFTKRMGVNGNGVIRLTATGAAGYNDGASTTLLLIRGGSTETGTVELVGGITIDKYIQCYSRTEDTKEAAHISSDGNNTLLGRIFTGLSATYVNIDSTSGTLNIGSSVDQAVSGSKVLRFRGNGNFDFVGTLTETSSSNHWNIAKLGSGTLTFGDALGMGGIVYTGDTAVFGGTLALAMGEDATLAGSPNITVASGATLNLSNVSVTLGGTQTLRGGGNVLGNIVADNGSTISPGGMVDDALTTYTDTAGTLSFANNLNMSAGATMVWNLAALSEANPGTDFDVLAVSGNLTLGESTQLTLNFDILEEALRPDAAAPNVFWTADHSWKIVDVDNALGSLTGMFGSITNPTFTAGTFSTLVDGKDILLLFDANLVIRIPGDTDGNMVVNESDALVLANNWGVSVTQGDYTAGDFNDDGVVNAADAAILAANWGDHTSGEEAAGVPEPGVVVLLLGLVLAVLPRWMGR